jgi:aconitase A
MSLLHTHIPKSKPRKKNAKQRELEAEWAKIMKKYEPTKILTQKVTTWKPSKAYIRETPQIPSLNSGFHDCSKKDSPVYTGTKVKGIGTMHKSNAVPIFSDEEAVDISTMRR